MGVKIVTIIMYGLIIALAIFTMWLDRQDWECPELYSDRKECRPGIGMPIRDTEPSNGDTPCESLKKIDRAAQAERQNIKWRQAMYLSIGLSFAVFLLVATPGSLPEWPVFYTSVAVIFGILYIHSNWYSYHRYIYAERHIRGGVGKLEKAQGCLA